MKKTLCALLLAVSFMLSGCMGLGIAKPDIALATYNTTIENHWKGNQPMRALFVLCADDMPRL